MSSEAMAVRTLLENQSFGILSTYSVDVKGFPFGSVTPYGLTDRYAPLIYISDIAQHTKNILNDHRVALTILEHHQTPSPDPQKHGRVTVIGKAIAVTDSDASSSDLLQRYFQRFPDSKSYQNTHGFQLFRIDPVRLRYIGGFGKIFWLEPNQLITS